jgi:hypothetical protein
LTENNMAVVKLMVGGATFNVRPSARLAAASSSDSNSRSSRQGGSSPFVLLPSGTAVTSSGTISPRSPTLRSTSSIAVSTGGTDTESDEEQVSAGSGSSAGAAVAASSTASQNGSSGSNGSNGSSGGSYTSISSTGQSVSSVDAAGASQLGSAGTRRRQQQQAAYAAGFRPDVLTMVSLSLDGEASDQDSVAALQQRVQSEGADADVYCSPDGAASDNSDSDLLQATASYMGLSTATGVTNEGSEVGGDGSRPSPRLSQTLKQLLADSISLNSTASIRLVDTADGGGSVSDGGWQQQQQGGMEPVACAVNGSSRQLDRSGNRTECALLEFGGRLEGRLLPGCGSVEQQRRVLQVWNEDVDSCDIG